MDCTLVMLLGCERNCRLSVVENELILVVMSVHVVCAAMDIGVVRDHKVIHHTQLN